MPVYSEGLFVNNTVSLQLCFIEYFFNSFFHHAFYLEFKMVFDYRILYKSTSFGKIDSSNSFY